MPHIALTVRSKAPGAPVSPFFAKAAGILLVGPSADDKVYVPNECGTSDWMCEELLRHKVRRVVCGFIDAHAASRLTAAGLDVRLGPCSVPAESLIERFEVLPKALKAVPGGANATPAKAERGPAHSRLSSS